ncbi:hypothetical protein PybrP1_008790 [[Pythium] brassicae (nom. inval.)]|nr:hypothetical protein PybrP1_008790 [[Pythium] brassicae (nom. inval.)]
MVKASANSSSDGGAVRIETQGYALRIRAVAGVESSCCVEQVDVAFDMGCCEPHAVSKAHVFLTHGHADHVGAFVAHAARRSLQRMKPAAYYAPAHLVPHLQHVLEGFEAMHGDTIPAQFVAVHALDEFHISPQWAVRAVPTVHRVPSFAYVLFRKHTKLKCEFTGMSGSEIAAKRREGVEVTTTTFTPEIAYTGDTTVEIFAEQTGTAVDEALQRARDDMLSVKVLITEATYVCDSKTPEDATARGHIHLDQLVALAHRFERVSSLVLVHFSAKYGVAELAATIERKVPAPLRAKILIGRS